MSDRSNAVRKSLFAKLNVAAVTGAGLATGGVHHKKAPEKDHPRPYVVFHRGVAQNVDYAFKDTVVLEDDLWVIKVISDEDSSTTLEPEDLNEAILRACETAIGDTLPLTGGYISKYVRRQADIPEFENAVNEQGIDRWLHTSGFFLRVAVT